MGDHQLKHNAVTRRLAEGGVVPFNPKLHGPLLDKLKSGSFHQSAAALSLYCTAYSPKAVHDANTAPFGYIHQEGENVVGVGVYRRFDDKEYGCIIPLKADSGFLGDFSARLSIFMKLSGVYVRFLKLDDYLSLLVKSGFVPAKENPWHFDAPEEDESLSSAILRIPSIIDTSTMEFSARHLRSTHNRGIHFLKRNRMSYRLEPLGDRSAEAMEIISKHFEQIRDSGKTTTSSAEDYTGLLSPEILERESVSAYLGILERVNAKNNRRHLPVSVFICESIGDGAVGIYAGITMRDRNAIFDELGIRPTKKTKTGFTALSPFTYSAIFRELASKGYQRIDMGGSEHAGLNQWKRDMGAEPNPTYWAFLHIG